MKTRNQGRVKGAMSDLDPTESALELAYEFACESYEMIEDSVVWSGGSMVVGQVLQGAPKRYLTHARPFGPRDSASELGIDVQGRAPWVAANDGPVQMGPMERSNHADAADACEEQRHAIRFYAKRPCRSASPGL